MMQRAANPGTIHVRIANVQRLLEEATARGDLVTTANLLEKYATYTSVYPEFDEEAWEAMPGYSTNDERTESEVFRDLNKRERYLLSILKEHGVFIKANHEIGDASSLDDPEEDLVQA